MFLSVIFLILKITDIKAERSNLCPVLTLPEHGFYFSGYCERKRGSLCGLGCFTGYRLAHGDSFRECQEDGTWTGDQPKCEEIRCPSLKTNLQVIQECSPDQNTTDSKVGIKCRARCHETGYRLLGPRIRECLVVGIWSGYEQFCVVSTESTVDVATTGTSTQSSTTTIPNYHDWFFIIHLEIKLNLLSSKLLISNGRILLGPIPEELDNPICTSMEYVNNRSISESSTSIFKANVSSLVLFGLPFNGLITRLEIWNEMLNEQQLLVSYRDCRRQNGDFFSWSKVSDRFSFETERLKSSVFCSGCSEPASIHGGLYHVSGYEIGASVEYRCNYGYEMMGANRAFCMVPSEWYPVPPICKYNPCTLDCELCEKKTGVCLKKQTRLNLEICDPPCDNECIDGQCTWSNINDNECRPPCPLGTRCVNRRCEPNLTPYCPVSCRPGQLCVDGRCGCYKGICEHGRACYEVCESGEGCFNWSCSCGLHGRCGKGELCQSNICMCGTIRGGCRPHEHCVNGRCLCKTSVCDRCDNACETNEVCLDGKCVCKERCGKVFCPFPCLNEGRCTGYYQCTCQQGYQGHRCEQRQRKTVAVP